MKGWAVATVMAGVLLKFPPERYAFYPRCPFFEASGLLCPGCGATRAAAALLHGRLVEALQWNALFVAAVFAAAVYAVFAKAMGRSWGRPPHWMIGLGVSASVAFDVARNIGL